MFPWSSHNAWSHRPSTSLMPCDTRTIVLPAERNSVILSRHLAWNSASPTASTSSMINTSGSTVMAMAKPRRTVMPVE